MKSLFKPLSTNAFYLYLTMGMMWTFYVLNLDPNFGDTLTFARAFYNPQWLPTDWYLTQEIAYRNAFNWVAGFLVENFGWRKGELLGHFFLLMGFSILFLKLSQRLQLPVRFHLVVVMAIMLCPAIGAGEWYLDSIDTKGPAYLFGISSLFCIFHQRWKLAALFLGLSCSFQALVGGYIGLTGLVVALSTSELRQALLRISLVSWLQLMGLYLIGGAFAVYFAYTWVRDQSASAFSSVSGESFSREEIAYVVVNTRLSHHLSLLDWFDWKSALLFAVGSLSVIVALRSRDGFVRFLGRCMVVFFGFVFIGLVAEINEKWGVTRFWLYRVPDVLIPMFSYYVLAHGWVQKEWPPGSLLRKSELVFLISMTFFVGGKFLLDLDGSVKKQDYYKKMESTRNWVWQNTSNKDVFIAPPVYKDFIIEFERPRTVAYKHFSYSDAKVKVWWQRMQPLLCGERKIPRSQRFRDILRACFRSLKARDFQQIAASEGARFLLTRKDHILNLPVAFRSEKGGPWLIYELRSKQKATD